MATKNPRKVCFVITSFIHYSRNFLVLDELEKRDDVELHIVLGGTALVPRYLSKHTDLREILRSEGHEHIHEAYFNLEGDSPIVKTKTAGVGISEFASIFNAIKPDVVVVRGDRFEVFSAVIAAAYMHIPIAHIEGGDVTGTIDESVRHAITKMAHIHFTTNDQAKERVIRMGEHPERVFNFGSPDVEVVLRNDASVNLDLSKTGSGLKDIDTDATFLKVMFHPVTTEVDDLKRQTKILLDAIYELKVPTLWYWPNSDMGAEEISSVLRTFNDQIDSHNIKFVRYLPPRDFLSLLRKADCFIGNSSAGIKECSVCGVPVVNVGSRQNNRLRTENVLDVDFDKDTIMESITAQLQKGKYDPSDVYAVDDTAKKIAEILAESELYTQKIFHE